MRKHLLIQIKTCLLLMAGLFFCASSIAYESGVGSDTNLGRIQLVSQQISLLKDRLDLSQLELDHLAKTNDKSSLSSKLQKASKQLLDKTELDVTISKSNLDNIDIELADSKQTIDWLEKGVQETENQLHVLNVFGTKIAKNDLPSASRLGKTLSNQKQLLDLEKKRVKYLRRLQVVARTSLQIKQENTEHISHLLKSKSMLHLKQKQMKQELIYQEQQNHWLKIVNDLNAKLGKIDPGVDRPTYEALEHEIFYANENANHAYLQMLMARYTDQVEQMSLAISKSVSITLLNEISSQAQVLIKQASRLKDMIDSRMAVITTHIDFLRSQAQSQPATNIYVGNLLKLKQQYSQSGKSLAKLDKDISDFRLALDVELQKELSKRQGFPNFSAKMLFDLGKELLLIPALIYQEFKSLSLNLARGLLSTHSGGWLIFAMIQGGLLLAFFSLKRFLAKLNKEQIAWREKMNSKWISLQWLRRNLVDILVISNLLFIFNFFNVPMQYYGFIANLAMVWLIVKSIITVARLCLIETTHDSQGQDVKLYNRLKWLISIGAVITAVTVFVHQLPLIYEIKALCDWIFLLLLMIVSILLLKFWRVVPHMVISHMDAKHPYFEKSIYLFGFLIPALMLVNSFIGLIGYVNLIMTVSRYEGIFLLVLVGYLVFRGLLSDAMEQLSRIMIKYVNNGWLLTEAILKPLDTILRIALMLAAGASLFLLYGWDAKSPIAERLTGLLHYQFAHVLNTDLTLYSIIQLSIVISVFYWTAKWSREFVYRYLMNHTKDMGIRNSIAILTQYAVVALGIFSGLRVLGVDLTALYAGLALVAVGIGFGLRDLANNFVCGFFILVERPLRVGDRVSINDIEGEVASIGSRAVVIRTYDHIDYLVPNSEIFNKSFTNLTAKDNIVRTKISVQIQRHDNPHLVKAIIQNVLAGNDDVLNDPMPNVYLRDMSDNRMSFEMRYFVDIRLVGSRSKVVSDILMVVWDEFNKNGIKPPYPQHEIFVRDTEYPVKFGFQSSET